MTTRLKQRLLSYPEFKGATPNYDDKLARRYYTTAKGRTFNGRFAPYIILESNALRRAGEVCPDYGLYRTVGESGSFSLLPVFAPQVSAVIGNTLASLGDPPSVTVLDMTAGIGMDTLLFLEHAGERRCVECISVEVDAATHAVLAANLAAAKTARPTARVEASAVHGNCLDFVIGFRPPVTFVYIDPPWGGKDYWEMPNGRNMLYLEDGEGDKLPIFDVVNMVLEEVRTDLVILKAPENFDLETFRSYVAAADVTATPILKPGMSHRRFMIAFYLVIIERKRPPPLGVAQ